jgi:hypothetical protein
MKPFAILALAVPALTLTACGDNLVAVTPLTVIGGPVLMAATIAK